MQSPTGVVLRRSISVCRAPRTQLQMHRVMTLSTVHHRCIHIPYARYVYAHVRTLQPSTARHATSNNKAVMTAQHRY